MQKMIVIKAISWKNRRVKVVNQWIPIYEDVNLKELEIGKEHEVELEKNLDNEWVLMKILRAPQRTNYVPNNVS